MHRKILVITTVTMLFVGVILALFPFVMSLGPSAPSRSARSSHDISDLANGDYKIEAFKRESAWDLAVLIVKDWDGSLNVFMLPMRGHRTVMPDRWWGAGYFTCSDFRPDLSADNKIAVSGLIRCHDKDISDSQRKDWQWFYDGKAKVSWIGDIYSPNYEVIEQKLYINR